MRSVIADDNVHDSNLLLMWIGKNKLNILKQDDTLHDIIFKFLYLSLLVASFIKS